METMVPVCARFQQCFSRYVRLFPRFSLRRVTIAACLTLALLACLLSISAHGGTTSATNGYTFSKHILRPASAHQKTGKSPVEWLQRNSNNKYDYNQQTSWSTLFRPSYWSSRPKAAIITLVRNEELSGIMQSMRQLEYHWNHKYRYPWIFFNEQPFSQAFKTATSNLISAPCFYEVVPSEHWSTPGFIDKDRYMDSLEYLDMIGVGKGWMLSYRNMCRWNSGFFYKHPRLLDYEFYWRVEPDVHFFCDITYDVFRFMRDNNLKYGFNMNILDDARSFPSLWNQTKSFVKNYPELVHPEADLRWLLDGPSGDETYNNCQFFSNFEIGDLRFFRSEQNKMYFDWLDRHAGGFFYERYGDAPIHTLSTSLFLPKSSTWWFRDIGYQHDINRHCPPASAHRCSCEPTALDENFFKLVPMESHQKKPNDTCIRQWLGAGELLEKKKGWDQETEKLFGGSGYDGYISDGMT